MQEKELKIDAVTYTSILHWLSKSGDVDGAVEMWEEMRGKRCTAVYKEMLQSGISPNCHTYTVLMEYLFRAGKYDEALDIFNKMQEAGVKPDKTACNILVEKCCKAGETGNDQNPKSNALWEIHPHISVECIGSGKEVEYTKYATEAPFDTELVGILLKKKNLLAIDSLLTELMNKDIRLDSEMISMIIDINCNHCRLDGALLAFRYSVKTGINLERTAYLALIGSLKRSNTFTDIVEIVAEMTHAGHSLGVYLSSLLIYRLGCGRRPTCAAKIFNLLPDDQKCVATYTGLVGVYFAAGTADKGLKIYKTMQRKGINPSSGTYCVLLAGLEKLGRVSNAENYRKEKKSLQKDAYFRESIPIEEKICDLLFARDVVS
ncbi:hypothetical protein COLO4_04840 [Corchorus olitorius]|uniref:Pentacotripeptide-repeat region of PRORP domain-containing protein n=1 Tax=Corchorus olitorius TaxID=93759 RepID=A0A1R3KSN0_9ROSI|nr:hypothetical protein COLO4_04840 [Corchorus olitorius]